MSEMDERQRIIDLLPEPTFILDSKFQIIATNSAAQEIFNNSFCIGESLLHYCDENKQQQFADYLHKCIRTTSKLIGAFFPDKRDGLDAFICHGALCNTHSKHVLLRMKSKSTAASKFIALSSKVEELNHEVKRRLVAESNARQQAVWFKVTLESIQDAVISTDTSGCISFMNKTAESLCGFSKAETTAKEISSVIKFIDFSNGQSISNPVDTLLESDLCTPDSVDYGLVRKDGTQIPVEVSASYILSESQLVGAILVFRDMTEKRQLKNQLLDRAEKLALENDRKNFFLSMLAHELRNPLASISNAVELLHLQNEIEPTDVTYSYHVLNRQVGHVTRLIDDLLDVSRLTSKKMRIVKQHTNFSKLCETAREDMAHLFSEAGIVINSRIHPGLFSYVDPVRMTQVIQNLLSNAVRYNNKGGRVWFSVFSERNRAMVQVSDNGIGMTGATISTIFEPFSQAEQDLDRDKGGLGLGLSIVKGLVALHDGTIDVTSDGMSKGCTFTVSLPLSKAQWDETANEETPTTKDAVRKIKILIIEDDDDAGETLQHILETLGYDTHLTTTGRKGIEAASTFIPNLIICDIGLPDLNGFQVATHIRQLNLPVKPYITALSGYDSDEVLEKARLSGFDNHLSKPASLERIQQVLLLVK